MGFWKKSKGDCWSRLSTGINGVMLSLPFPEFRIRKKRARMSLKGTPDELMLQMDSCCLFMHFAWNLKSGPESFQERLPTPSYIHEHRLPYRHHQYKGIPLAAPFSASVLENSPSRPNLRNRCLYSLIPRFVVCVTSPGEDKSLPGVKVLARPSVLILCNIGANPSTIGSISM